MGTDNNITDSDFYSSSTTYRSSSVSNQKRYVTKSLLELGSVPELSDHIIFFNRIPKTGSEMLVMLIQWLQGHNNFRHVRLLNDANKRLLTRLEQENFVDEVTNYIKTYAVPMTFDRHIYFVNFTSFDKQSPTYINLIRDPVQKIISRFYYNQRKPNKNNPDLIYAPHREPSKYQKTLEECIVAGDPECHFISGKPYDLTIPYFCGQDPECRILNNEWALQRAKNNVERYYPVVGVLEELNSTLRILESKLPYFFKGIQKVYFDELMKPHYNKNRKKPMDVDDDVKKYLKESLSMEYDFYYWIQARLFQQIKFITGEHNNH
ncbi:uronyl 2-sulfotransferase-like [Chrysoperla carnea]|uniref:uronyl 2-sulfotransferase-like n=1 Tax=Chrysoperla carnea TaxID=189513 RepID=UPI001D05D420|nr:uronyl 2-sulfotransferase-like [Chrysoperla carnea]